MAGLNSKTIAANTEELRALDTYVKVRGELADAMLNADRKVFNYVEHRDDILENDHQDHLARMEDARVERELNQKVREERLRSMQAATERAAVERAFDHKILVQAKEAELAQAEWKAAHAQWGRDAFNQTLGYRRERLDHLYKTGAIDKEIDRLVAESLRDEALGGSKPAERMGAEPHADQTAIAVLEQMLVELDQEIEIAQATHASDEQKAALYALRGRLKAKLEQLRAGGASAGTP